MFGDIALPSFAVEAISADYLLKGLLQPRGGLMAYFNDRQWANIALLDATVYPLAADRRVAAIEQAETVVHKAALQLLSLVDAEQAAAIALPPTWRPVIFFLAHFAVQGQLHVSADAHDHDIFSVPHDFYAVTRAVVYPLRQVAHSPTREVPLLVLSRRHVQVYRVTGPHQSPR